MTKTHVKQKDKKKHFFCPLGSGVMWWHGFEYSECPIAPSQRDMPECKECKLRIDKKWADNKETWSDKPAKPKRKKPRRKKGERK